MLYELCRLGADAELKTIPSTGTQLVEMSLAYDYFHKGEKKTQWIKGVHFGDRAVKIADYLKKGTRIVAYIDDVHIETYTKQSGEVKSYLEGRVIKVDFASSVREKHEQRAQQQAATPAQATPPHMDSFDDDIPF